MTVQLDLGGLCIDVVKKNIKNVHLSVYPPSGKVRISAPLYMELDTIRVFAISKLAWIKSQQRKILAQERETPREYLDRESHYLWGKRYLLQIVEKDATPNVELTHGKLILQLRPGTDDGRRQEILDSWYREQIKIAMPDLIAKWEPLLGVSASRIFVQRMKTKWGSCNPSLKNIRLNTDLAKKPPECLEYIVVHELAHLIEPTHNARFTALMELFMPKWRHLREELNRLPVRHEDWDY
ncbi:M48 family metallopeptidase [Undibacterium parvum]|uniref:M48 family metallopeptidase n=2 Tax=Undibacterium TaxID=401469 RepID=A0A6M4A351_9BURK|nr:SprT family zinc-dependent metalloprotease [Undibacterium parvum]AZP11213.1 M48 family peptidase [Undibacterium parvum]QJQ05736.1 M48 family metallopeptidase [Undibacterium piscinae]